MKTRWLKPCPNCGKSGRKMLINRVWFSGSIFDKHLFFIECPSCHWCGKTKLFLWRAKRAWNKDAWEETRSEILSLENKIKKKDGDTE